MPLLQLKQYEKIAEKSTLILNKYFKGKLLLKNSTNLNRKLQDKLFNRQIYKISFNYIKIRVIKRAPHKSFHRTINKITLFSQD